MVGGTDAAQTNTSTAPAMAEAATRPTDIPWSPVLTGALKGRAINALQHVTRVLEGADAGAPDLANGDPGSALFFAYRSMLAPALPWRDRAVSILRRSMDLAASVAHPDAFLHGLTGVAWAIEHLRREFALACDAPQSLIVDVMLRSRLSETPWRGVYDLGHGLVGYGVYALESIAAPAKRALLEQIVLRLHSTSLISHDGATWCTAPQNLNVHQRTSSPNGHFNLGLAHGIPSIIALLGQACTHGVTEDQARRLMDDAIRWLLAQKLPDGSGSSFGTVIPLGVRSVPRQSRLAWCFGDLGLSAALYWAARSVDSSPLAEEMLEIARAAALRSPESSGVKEASICHGAAGNAHIFNRFYQATGRQDFLDAARYWFERTVSYYETSMERCIADAESTDRFVPTPRGWPGHTGIFGGLAGIGLALLSAVTAREPAWDRVMLVSMPPCSEKAREMH
jgi:lantibiotic modifying enzyme